MFYLPLSLQAFDTPEFSIVLKQEICSLDPILLPLQQGLENSSYAISDKLSLTVLKVAQDEKCIYVKAGLLYNGIIAGCSCTDDPTPTDETNEYCEVSFNINRQTAQTTVNLVC